MVPGATTDTLVLPSAALTDAGEYVCGVTDDLDTYYSDKGTLGVADPLDITQDPESAAVNAGRPQTFSVIATGGFAPLTYEWLKDGDVRTTSTDNRYMIPHVQMSDAGKYRALIWDANTMALESDEAMLTVIEDEDLPVAGIVGVVLLVGAYVLGGVVALRRKK
jgi:hypothetical protein